MPLMLVFKDGKVGGEAATPQTLSHWKGMSFFPLEGVRGSLWKNMRLKSRDSRLRLSSVTHQPVGPWAGHFISLHVWFLVMKPGVCCLGLFNMMLLRNLLKADQVGGTQPASMAPITGEGTFAPRGREPPRKFPESSNGNQRRQMHSGRMVSITFLFTFLIKHEFCFYPDGD